MRKLALVSVVVAVAAPGCQTWRGDSAPARPDEDGNAATQRASAVYAAVIRRLVAKDFFLGEGQPFERVFVVRMVGDRYFRPEAPPTPFSPTVERGLLDALRDLPIRPIAHPDAALVDDRSCRGLAVRRGGVLIGVGPVARAQGDEVRVGTWIVSGCLGKNGQWLTYALKPADEGWRVVRTRALAIA
jgi:hypothetical protein